MELYIILLIAAVLIMGGLVIYTIRDAKSEIERRVEELACKVEPMVKKVSGEEYECEKGEIKFKT